MDNLCLLYLMTPGPLKPIKALFYSDIYVKYFVALENCFAEFCTLATKLQSVFLHLPKKKTPDFQVVPAVLPRRLRAMS